MASDDSDFGYSKDPESGELIIMGIGESDLEAKLDKLKRIHGVEFLIGAPQVAYRETLARSAECRLHTQEADRRHRPVCAREVAAGGE